jgi:hypothetical protein
MVNRKFFLWATMVATISAVLVGSSRDAMAFSAGCSAVNAGQFDNSNTSIAGLH